MVYPTTGKEGQVRSTTILFGAARTYKAYKKVSDVGIL